MEDRPGKDVDVGLGIAAATVVGLFLGLLLFEGYRDACADGTGRICQAIADSPPWYVLTGAIAAPAVLLTWYWRTVHKEKDIEKGRKDTEHAAEVLVADKTKADHAHNLATQAHLTDRFARAVELLGSAAPAVRLGGIYALERLARDSETDRSVIIETLAAFIRMQPQPGTDDHRPAGDDVRAAAAVLGRRQGEESVDLHETNLRGVNLFRGSFRRCSFIGTLLNQAFLNSCNFERAFLTGSDLRSAVLVAANLDRASLARADLTRANLSQASLRGARLANATLTGALFGGADLTDADLTGAEMENAMLEGAKLDGAVFKDAKVSKAAIEQATRDGVSITLTDDEFQALLRGERSV